MGKLIELDAVITETWKDTGYSDPLNVMTAIRDRLEALPTVDAVPVSWIMAQVAERKERGTAFDLSVASTLRTMVKEWKDETD